MPIPAQGMYGLMAETEAVNWLTNACVLNGASPHDMWRQAAVNIGGPFPRAGNPDILDIPADRRPYLDQLAAQVWFQQAFPGPYSFKLVEIEPLLAYQFSVCDEHANTISASVAGAPNDIDALLQLALPHDLTPALVNVSVQGNNLVMMSPDLNFGVFGAGQAPHAPMPGVGVAGPLIGNRAPAVQVARFNGRYYLRNGYHRIKGAAAHGTTHIPCVLLECNTYEELIGPDALVFSQSLMESALPPTIGHFTHGRSSAINLKAVMRVVTISWTSLVIPEAS